MQPADAASIVLHILALPRTIEVTDFSVRPMRPRDKSAGSTRASQAQRVLCFTWNNTVQKTLDLYEELADNGNFRTQMASGVAN
jgi:hypothetical protein